MKAYTAKKFCTLDLCYVRIRLKIVLYHKQVNLAMSLRDINFSRAGCLL
jgi:hypothetical protein